MLTSSTVYKHLNTPFKLCAARVKPCYPRLLLICLHTLACDHSGSTIHDHLLQPCFTGSQ
jgi:hypothetical protein